MIESENLELLSNLNTKKEDLMDRIEILTIKLRELCLSKRAINDIIEDVENTFYEFCY